MGDWEYRCLSCFTGRGWRNNVTTCLAQGDTRLDSSKHRAMELVFSRILSNIQSFNPYFYDWNIIKVRYCDESSFTGGAETVNPATKLHFRGGRIFIAIVEDLLTKGMEHARNAILSVCSAGGLTAIGNCDKFHSLWPHNTKVKHLGDAGFFIKAKDVPGNQHTEAFHTEVVATHGSAKNLPASCTSGMKPDLVSKTSHTPNSLV
ncbi:hypothetical protein MLD38_001068 [Melastoma candidum]|uniref:Uncharacterized protein n=1 Tax=Melastoma candidum TaxID=119954 RepID=A0ACB9SC33_9MYRT|nr:hypothetical protein MLD38_001068 [Melastoma candidum]